MILMETMCGDTRRFVGLLPLFLFYCSFAVFENNAVRMLNNRARWYLVNVSKWRMMLTYSSFMNKFGVDSSLEGAIFL